MVWIEDGERERERARRAVSGPQINRFILWVHGTLRRRVFKMAGEIAGPPRTEHCSDGCSSLSEDLRSTNRSEQWTVTSRSISLSFPNFNFASTERAEQSRAKRGGGRLRGGGVEGGAKQYIFKLYTLYCIWIKNINPLLIVGRR